MKCLKGAALSTIAFSLVAIFAAPAMAADSEPAFELVAVPSDGIEAYMPVANGSNGVPKSIQGLWWMDGNPLGDLLLTLGNATWNSAERIALLPVYGAANYSFLPTDAGRKAYQTAIDLQLVYEVHFNEDFTSAYIVPINTILGTQVHIPNGLTDFTMNLLEDGHWLRASSLFGVQVESYNLRRIVQPNGTRDPAYADYLKVAPKESLIAVPTIAEAP